MQGLFGLMGGVHLMALLLQYGFKMMIQRAIVFDQQNFHGVRLEWDGWQPLSLSPQVMTSLDVPKRVANEHNRVLDSGEPCHECARKGEIRGGK